MIGVEHARAFLAALHPNPSASALVRLVALPPKGAPVVRWHWDPACGALAEILELNARGFACFVQVNPCRTMEGGGYSNVAYTHALVLDIDTLKTGISYAKMLPDLAAWNLAPSAVVHSGHGGHLYYFLDRPYAIDEAAPVAERLCAAMQSDAVHNPNRIMRLPGTWNWKETPPQPCYIESLDSRRYTLAHVDAALDAIGAPAADPLPEATFPIELNVEPPESVAALVAALPARLAEAVRTGRAPAGAVDMSALDWAIMRALVLARGTDEQIRAVYAAYPVRAFKVDRGGEGYFERTLRNVRADVLADLADQSVDVALLQTGLFLQTPDGSITPDPEACRNRIRTLWGLPVEGYRSTHEALH